MESRDKHARSKTVSDEVGHFTTFTYGENKQLVSVSDALGFMYKLSYASSGNLIRILHSDDSQELFEYDDAGHLTVYQSRNKDSMKFEYGDDGSLTVIKRESDQQTTLLYDNLGRIISAANPKIMTISYNPRGLPQNVVSQYTDSHISYDYTPNGLRSGRYLQRCE